VGYADAGAVRKADGRFTKTYADVGAGLRFGNLKSTFGPVLTISVAVPLVKEPGVDNYQVVVGNVIRF
jgi:maltoporin